MVLADWLDQHTSQAPAALRARVREHVGQSAAPGPLPVALAAAGRHALGRVVDHPGDRSVALDLLAADALVTLALLAQAQAAPDRLGEFATAVLHAGAPRP
jgi:hypothetical protein